MADIFISYASSDRDRARMLAHALNEKGWSVWWDRDIPFGQSFDAVIEKALAQATCLIVLWSAQSVQSKWVRNEAAEGEARGILVPAFIDAVHAPLAFRLLNGANLQDWRPGSPHPEFERLVERVSEMLGPNPSSTTEPTAPVESPDRGAEPAVRPGDNPSHRVRSWPRTIALIPAALLLLFGLYRLTGRGPAPQSTNSVEQAGKAVPASPPPVVPASVPQPVIDSHSRPAAPRDEGRRPSDAQPARDETQVSAAGQITLHWNGVNVLGWTVLDADTRKIVLRQSAVGPKASVTEDLAPGNYVVTLGHPEFPPVPVTVRAGQAAVVTR